MQLVDTQVLGRNPRLRRFAAASALFLGLVAASNAQAADPPIRGFMKTAPAIATGAELSRQPKFWALEVQLKPMRLIWVNTGAGKKEPVIYQAYKVVRREPALKRAVDPAAVENQLDNVPDPQLFIPELTLVAFDSPKSKVPLAIYPDEVIPEAVEIVNRIERRSTNEPAYQHSMGVIQELSAPAPQGARDAKEIFGVATWRNVDFNADAFQLVLSGFSNGYEIRESEDTQKSIWRKVMIQKYVRRGDRFDLEQKEFEFTGDPLWVYRPDSAKEKFGVVTPEEQNYEAPQPVEKDASAPADEAAESSDSN